VGRVAAEGTLNVAAPDAATNVGPGPSIAHRRAVRCAMLYAVLLVLAFGSGHASGRLDIQSLLLGFACPGGGFLAWTEPASTAPIGLLLCASSGALFLMALALWFATGNIVMPGLVWFGAALTASGVTFF